VNYIKIDSITHKGLTQFSSTGNFSIQYPGTIAAIGDVVVQILCWKGTATPVPSCSNATFIRSNWNNNVGVVMYKDVLTSSGGKTYFWTNSKNCAIHLNGFGNAIGVDTTTLQTGSVKPVQTGTVTTSADNRLLLCWWGWLQSPVSCDNWTVPGSVHWIQNSDFFNEDGVMTTAWVSAPTVNTYGSYNITSTPCSTSSWQAGFVVIK
jgi:hypothetical protein